MYTTAEDRLIGASATLLEAGLTLRDYQEDGVDWMFRLEQQGQSGILADDPGLGKTLQTLALCDDWVEGDSPTLIVVPTSIIDQWADLARQLYGPLAVYLHHGRRRHPHLWEMPRTRVVITTYGLLLHDPALQTKHWHRAVLDEIHYIKNHRSRTAQAAYRLQATFRWGLSGTPVQNTPRETKALFRFVLGLDGNARQTDLDLPLLIRNRLLRRTKQTHLTLPEIQIATSEIDFETESEAKFYRRVQQDVSEEFQELSQMDLATTDSMLELLLRLRQTSCHPQLVLNGLSRKYGVQPKPWTGHSSKHLHLIRMLESHRGEAALVFCQFTEEMDLLQTLLREHGFRSARLDGSLSNQERRLTLDLCRRPGEIEVCLIQIRAGGVGLNLQEFNRVYLTSPDWNPCNEIQAIARAHRMGQQRPVTVTKLVLSGVDATQPEGTAPQSMVDSRILDIQNRKRLLMSDLLGEPDLLHNGCRHRRARLTRSDWKRLLRTT